MDRIIDIFSRRNERSETVNTFDVICVIDSYARPDSHCGLKCKIIFNAYAG